MAAKSKKTASPKTASPKAVASNATFIQATSGRGQVKKRVSMQEKCGVLFPVTRLNNMLKRKFQGRGRVRVGAGIYMAAVLEYLTAEMLELAGNKAIHVKKKRIQPRHILLTIRNDEEFDKLLQNVTIPGGGVSSEIHPFLLPKAKKSTKSALDTEKTTSPPQLCTPAQDPK